MAFEHLFSPLRVGPLELRNRTMMTTHGPRISPGRYLAYLAERSRDVGLVGVSAGAGISSISFAPGRLVEGYLGDPDAVMPDPFSPEGIALYDRAIARMREQSDIVHRNGALIVGQVLHTGISRHEDNLQPAIGPSHVRDELRRHVPHVLSVDEIEHLVASFGDAARRVREADMDGVEVHAAHGYLVNQFLSPRTNHRTDDYGGSPEKRRKFLLDILGSIRAAAGPDFPVGVRLPGTELTDDGLTTEEICDIGADLARAGVCYLNISSGNYSGLRSGLRLAYVAPDSVPEGPNLEAAAAIRRVVGLPVVVSGRLTDVATADAVVADGRADIVGFTRALIADSRMLEKARNDDTASINRCIACNECHQGPGRPMSCAVNPRAGREEELVFRTAVRPRRVVVVGGGPAGLQCALGAAERGHRVTLLERQGRLGGLLPVLAENPHHALFRRYVDHLEDRLAASTVDVRLEVEADGQIVGALGPDAVIVAVGGRERVPDVPGVDRSEVATALAVYRGEVDPGPSVAVVGGLEEHLPPLRIAQLLAGRGKRVTLFTELPSPGEAIEPATRLAALRDLLRAGVEIVPLARLAAVADDGVVIENVLTLDRAGGGSFDSVVICSGLQADGSLAATLRSGGLTVSEVGDCLAPRRLVHATLDGARQAAVL